MKRKARETKTSGGHEGPRDPRVVVRRGLGQGRSWGGERLLPTGRQKPLDNEGEILHPKSWKKAQEHTAREEQDSPRRRICHRSDNEPVREIKRSGNSGTGERGKESAELKARSFQGANLSEAFERISRVRTVGQVKAP